MTKTKKILLAVGAAVLVVCLALVLAFCGKPGSGDVDTNPDVHEGEIWTFTIQLTAEGGAPLEGIGVYVYEDQEQTELTWFDKTDANGMISFTAPVKDGYRYAVLSDVPAGYIAEDAYPITGKENLFVLKAAAIEELDPENVRYKLGDTIGDFTVVDTNGDEYKLSEMLKSKKAVVLNFWYIECNPCRAEFPYMNEAYAEFAGDIGLIAMNPVNDNEADIAAFKSELELDFPVAMADPAWADMLQLTAYPTTVVIDRTGVISLYHVGSIDNADTFKQIFQYFAAEDYTPGVIESLEDLPPLEEEPDVGTAENPDQQGATGTKITLKPGQEYHLDFYKASGMYMNVTGSDFYVIYDGKRTESESGYVGMMVESEGIYYPVKVIIGNPTEKEQNISIAFGALKGSQGNPYKLSLGEFDMKTYAGNEEGVFGTYTAEESGTLTIRCLSSSVKDYGFFLYNLRSYAMRNTTDDGLNDEDGYLFVSVKVKKGDQVQFSVGVDRDENNTIPAGSFRFELLLEEGDGEEDKQAEPPKTAYAITVTDENGNPVEGVAVNLKGEFTYEPTEQDPEELEPVEVKVDLNLTTDAEGYVISEQVTGPYTAIIRVPDGYELEQTEYELTADVYTVTVQLKKIVKVDYAITVLDADGQPVPGVMLMMGTNLGTTDAEGKYAITLEEAEYSVLVVGGIPEGYLTPTDFFQIGLGEAELTITLEKEAEPEPEYTDIFGEFPIVTELLAPGQKAYYNIYNAGGANLVIEDADAFVIINEETYEAVDGVVTAPVPETMGRMPAQVIIGNGGAETESYTANVVFPVGTQQNPEELKLGDFVTELAAGNSVGYYYVWTAEEDGALTLVYTGETGVAGENFDVLLTNMTSYACPMMSESENLKSVSVDVKAGEQVSIQVFTYPDESWEYPAFTMELNAAFGKVHVHEYTAVVTAPSCVDAGYTTYTCACGESYVGDEVEALGHDYTEKVIPPTTTTEGYTLHTCSRCGESYKDNFTDKLPEDPIEPPHVHSYDAVVTAPTCTVGGYTTYTCACGDSYVGDEVAATGHNYEKVVTEPTCAEGGYTTYTCACGDVYTDDKVEPLGHDYVSEVVDPTTSSEGYTLHTCSRCGESYKDNFTDMLPEIPSTVNYAVTVAGFDGTPMSGVAVQILKDGKIAKVGVTDVSGKLTAGLDAGEYTVKLAFTTTGNHYEEKTAVLTAEAPELTICVTTTVPSPGVEDHWMLGKADAVEEGGTYVSIQQNVMTYFLFTPTEEGTYSFTTSDPAAEISYWGSENFPTNQTANTDYKDNKFTLSINQSYLGQSYVIGITGADSCILIIEREGASAFNPEELPYTNYEPKEEPKAFTVTETGTLTYVDLGGKTEDYTLVKGEDGFYHIGAVDGPVAYICLGSQAPYLSLYTMCGGGGAMSGAPFRYTDYSDLDNIVKEDYTECVLTYGDCMDKTYGVYPVTEDIIYIMQMGVEYKGWAKQENPNFLFTEEEEYNPELGWMFLICYFEN